MPFARPSPSLAAFINSLPKWFPIPVILRTPLFFYLTSHPGSWRHVPPEWAHPWPSSSPAICLFSRLCFTYVVSVILACDLMQWTQPVDNPLAKWRLLASFSYVDATPSSGLISRSSTPPPPRSGKRLSPISIFAYSDHLSHSLDANPIRHGMHISEYITEIQMGNETGLTPTGGWMKCWLHSGERDVAVYRSSSDRTNSSIVPIGRSSTMNACYPSWSPGTWDGLTLTVPTLLLLWPTSLCAACTAPLTTACLHRFCRLV